MVPMLKIVFLLFCLPVSPFGVIRWIDPWSYLFVFYSGVA